MIIRASLLVSSVSILILLVAVATAALPGALAFTADLPDRVATDVGGPVAPGTVWTLAGSPYVTTADVVVPAGVTLTIEPSVTVRLAPFHKIKVEGSLQAVGDDGQRITFEATDPDQEWGSVQLLAGSGPSEIAFADLRGGGATRKAILEIATDEALVRNCLFTESRGVGIEIQDGASPTLRDSILREVTQLDADPPSSLRIYGPSDAIIESNLFQSNVEAIRMDADASPRFLGNRFGYNGVDGVLVRGLVKRSVEWPSLGPRHWPYHVYSTGIEIEEGASLTIQPGATLAHGTAASIRVRGTLRVNGEASNKVFFTADQNDPKPGQWPEIKFEDSSVDYDEDTGEGSLIDHAIIEYGGSSSTGAVYIRRSSPLITNTTIRDSGRHGMTIYGEEASPDLRGDVFDSIVGDGSIALFITQGATPTVSFSIFRDNLYAVRTNIHSRPTLGPHNRFSFNQTYGVFNADDTVCVNAEGNDWSGTNGPADSSDLEDACGLGANDGDGDLVSDNVDYLPYEGQLPIPVIQSPRCGTLLELRPEISGLAPPNVDVIIYDNQTEIGRVRTDEGEGGVAVFTFTPPPMAIGSHVVQAQSQDGAAASGISDPLEFVIDPDARVDPTMTTISYDLHGTHYVVPYNYLDENGCLTLSNRNGWTVRAHPGAPLTYNSRLVCSPGVEPVASLEYLGARYPLTKGDDDLFHGTFELGEGGPFSIDVTCGSSTRTWNLGNLSIEYEGFTYNVDEGHLARIRDATVTLLQYDANGNDYFLWRANEYYGQTNPQTTGEAGWYAFYPPPGRYIVQAEAEDFQKFISLPQDITVEPIVLTIGMRPIGEPLLLPSLRKNVR